MMKFEHTKVMNWEAAIRGMRNPLESWDKSDSYVPECCGSCEVCSDIDCQNQPGIDGDIVIGPNDLDLMKGESDSGYCYSRCESCGREDCSLIYGEHSDSFYFGKNDLALAKRLRNAGTDHRKFMRQIIVSVDITAPLYWWKEFDTYKVGTVANSCSTMHCIHKKPFDVSDFAHDWLIGFGEPKDSFTIFEKGLYNPEDQTYWAASNLLMFTIRMLNFYRERYLETKDKLFWYQMIQLLPESYLQKRTITFNYEVLANIARSRRDHKLDEWSVEFMDWMRSLPYSEDLIFETEKG